MVRPRAARAGVLAARRLSGRPVPLRELPAGGRVTSVRAARVLASAGALAAVSIACREHAPSPKNDATNGCLRLDGPVEPVGFDATFSIAAKRDCAGRTAPAPSGRIAWTQIEGPTVRALAPARDGFQLTARAPSLADAVGGAIPWGVVPLSPRTRGEIVLRATWSDDRGGSETADVRVVAAYRSRGLPNTPVGVRSASCSTLAST